MADDPLAATARDWALTLTRLPSVNGSADEARFPDELVGLLCRRPALAGAEVWTIPVAGDRLGRSVVALLVRGAGRRTLVLTGHYDTVPIEDYGDLAHLALEPEPLRTALLDRLRRAAASEAERRALADLEGGEYLPGRGLLDMKAGLAAGLAVAEAFAAEAGQPGNLLFLAVPDEEASSLGARQVAASLDRLCAEHGLDAVAAINLDSIADDGDGSAGRAVAMGSVGKLLLTALVVGRPSHACYPFAGLNAAALLGSIAAEVEWSPELSDASRGEPGVPATLLSLKDVKQHYDVTTPWSAFASWNVLTYGRGPEDLLAAFARLCGRATDRLLAQLAERAAAHGINQAGTVPACAVVDYASLAREALVARPGLAEELTRLGSKLAASTASLPEQCRFLTEALWQASGRSGPAVVIGFGSLPYLPVSLGSGEEASRLRRAVERAVSAVDVAGTVARTAFFPGISDMSFLGEADLAAVPAIAANTPCWEPAIAWPTSGAVAGVPIINAGPWGRDYHTPLERLHAPYAFEVLPRLLASLARDLLVATDDLP